MALLVHSDLADFDQLRDDFAEALAPYPVFVPGAAHDPAAIHYVLTWRPGAAAFEALSGLKAILSYGAGVDALMQHPALPADVPIVRFVDTDLRARMSDYVVAEVTRHHRLDSIYRAAQARREWIGTFPRRADEIHVGIMGLGTLGAHAAGRLSALGFDVRGWSRSRRTVAGVESFAGGGALDAFLSGTDILVNLLPLTPETRHILNRDLFAKLRRDRLQGGPALINAARGGHLEEADLVAALRDGTLGAASLDVFVEEPLSGDSPLWDAPNCYVTPHVAAVSRAGALVTYFAGVIKAHEAGAPLENVVDKARGY